MVLYHGTVGKFIRNIGDEGLRRMNRHHVHLCNDREMAEKVGERRGSPIILTIRSEEISRDGLVFFVS